MSSEFGPDSGTQQCVVCHSTYPLDVAVCAFCGNPLPQAQGRVSAELHPPLPPPILPDSPKVPVSAAALTAAGQDTQPAEANEPRRCAFCGWENPPEAERCIVCGAALPLRELQANQRALLEVQLEHARVHAAIDEADSRRASRWRWAAWGLSRLWRST